VSDQIAVQPTQPRKFASAMALLAGFVTVLVLSLATDQLFHVLGVYPPWGEPMRGTGQNLLALSYRVVYAMLGSYIAARLAPRNPMRHAMILGAIGFVLSTLGAIGGIAADLGPIWFPVALVLTTLPCAWLGGFIHEVTTEKSR
jgi:hypothetical protein